MDKPIPPTPPRELGDNYFKWLLEIGSPSLICSYSFGSRERGTIMRYLQELAEYEIKLLEWKIEKRIATREEYKRYIRMLKRGA